MAAEAIGGFGSWKRDGRGMLTTNVAEAGGFVKSDPALARPDLQLHFCLGIVDDHNRKLHLGRGYSLHVCALRPYSRGEVRLASADLRTAPLIDPKFLSDERDLETLVAGAKISQRILSAPSMAAMNGVRSMGASATRMCACANSSVTMQTRSTTPSAPAAWAAMRPPWSIRNCGCAA